MADECVPLSAEEYDRLARFIDEAHVPVAERFYCAHPQCGRLFAVPNRDLIARLGSGGGAGPASPAKSAKLRPIRHVLNARKLFSRLTEAKTDEEVVHVGHVELTAQEDPLVASDGDVSLSLRRRIEASPPFATCPYCERDSCVRCKVPAHSLVTCAEVASGSADASLTATFVNATSKGCPRYVP